MAGGGTDRHGSIIRDLISHAVAGQERSADRAGTWDSKANLNNSLAPKDHPTERPRPDGRRASSQNEAKLEHHTPCNDRTIAQQPCGGYAADPARAKFDAMLNRPASLPRPPVLLLLLALAGCATPESRVRHGLVEAGLPPAMAQCMAKPMAHRLSTAQLARLGALGQSLRQDPRDKNINQIMHDLRALGDPQIVRVTMTSAMRCAAFPAP